ncbi:MAG: hypothetical protein ACFFDT_30280 [Candidatus Hodarchaeota archaeon]
MVALKDVDLVFQIPKTRCWCGLLIEDHDFNELKVIDGKITAELRCKDGLTGYNPDLRIAWRPK